MKGHVFIAQGDITQLAADAIAYSSSRSMLAAGDLYSSFEAHVPGFAEAFERLGHKDEHRETGATYWLPLERHSVVVVAATGVAPSGDTPRLVAHNAIVRAVNELRAAGPTRRLLIALPAFRLGGGGDQWDRLNSARAQVRGAADALASLGEVDVVFVTYTAALYRIYLEARRKELGETPGPRWPALEQALGEGSGVLFVGAGMSSGAGLPTWDELIDRLCAGLGIKPDRSYDALDVAQWYRDRFQAEGLGKVLHETFAGAGQPTLGHYLLLALPLQHIVTTNYDDLIERALHGLKRHPVTVIRQEDVSRTGGAGTYVVKLHGDASHPQDIVLSRDDYASFFEQRPAMSSLLEGLMLNRTFFFVGYSLRDPNFRHLFSRVARMLRDARRPAFATSFADPGPTTELVRAQWKKEQLEFVPIIAEGGHLRQVAFWRFLDRLGEQVMLRKPPLMLADDTPTPPALAAVASGLSDAGDRIEALLKAPLSGDEAGFLADLLKFLTAHGWRPSGARPSRLFQKLASQTKDPGLRRELLVAALHTAETLHHAQRIRKELERLS
jgi:hypothetical protein